MIWQSISHYTIVYKAEDTKRTVALRFVAPELIHDPTATGGSSTKPTEPVCPATTTSALFT